VEGVTAEPIGVIEATCPAYLRACYVRLVHLSFVPVPSDVSHRQAPLTCGSSVPVARICAVAGACLPVNLSHLDVLACMRTSRMLGCPWLAVTDR